MGGNTDTFTPTGSEPCKADSEPFAFETTKFTLVHCNINGCTAKHMAELNAHLQLLSFPIFVALNESKLDEATTDAKLKLTKYVLVAGNLMFLGGAKREFDVSYGEDDADILSSTELNYPEE